MAKYFSCHINHLQKHFDQSLVHCIYIITIEKIKGIPNAFHYMDRSQSLFYFLPQKEGQSSSYAGVAKKMREMNFLWEDRPQFHFYHAVPCLKRQSINLDKWWQWRPLTSPRLPSGSSPLATPAFTFLTYKSVLKRKKKSCSF